MRARMFRMLGGLLLIGIAWGTCYWMSHFTIRDWQPPAILATAVILAGFASGLIIEADNL